MILENTSTPYIPPMCCSCLQFFKDKESKAKHWGEIHLMMMNLKPSEANRGSLKWVIYINNISANTIVLLRFKQWPIDLLCRGCLHFVYCNKIVLAYVLHPCHSNNDFTYWSGTSSGSWRQTWFEVTNKEQRNFTHFYLEIIFFRMTKHKTGNKTNLKRKKLILSQNA